MHECLCSHFAQSSPPAGDHQQSLNNALQVQWDSFTPELSFSQILFIRKIHSGDLLINVWDSLASQLLPEVLVVERSSKDHGGMNG